MKFRPNARLDPSQVEDVRGRSGLGGGGIAVGGGGLGLVGVIIYIAIQLLSNGQAGGALGPLDGSTVATQSPGQVLGSDCQTGADANAREDCRIVGYINSIQAYWGKTREAATRSRRRSSSPARRRPAAARRAPTSARSTARSTRRSTSTSASSTSCARSSARAPARSPRPTCSRTSTATTCRTSPAPRQDRQRPAGPEERVGEDRAPGRLLRRRLGEPRAADGYLTKVTPADVKDALSAAAAVGDDRIQKETQGRVNPETWTHGSSAQREQWFTTGWQTGDPNRCNTFA